MRVVDLHCDTLSCLRRAERRGEPKSLLRNDLQVDIEKLERGGYLLQCFAAFVDLAKEPDPLAAAMEQIGIFYRELALYPDRIGQVRTWSDIEENRCAGRLSALLTAEEGAICRGDPSILRSLYELGVRIMTLTWNHENGLGFPNHAAENRPDAEHGLTERGAALLAEMERLGIVADVSHLSDAGFRDVCRLAKKPFIASHSNARAVCGHVRNLTDGMLRAVADRGGIAGINYCVDFLDPAGQAGTASRMAEHIVHMRRVGGIDMIALGSDYDGIDRAPELYDCSCLPMLERELRRRGFTESEIEKVFSGNALRLLRDALL